MNKVSLLSLRVLLIAFQHFLRLFGRFQASHMLNQTWMFFPCCPVMQVWWLSWLSWRFLSFWHGAARSNAGRRTSPCRFSNSMFFVFFIFIDFLALLYLLDCFFCSIVGSLYSGLLFCFICVLILASSSIHAEI